MALVGVLAVSVMVAAACRSGASDPAAGGSSATTGTSSELSVVGVQGLGGSWASVDPAEAGFDPAALDRVAADAEAAGSNCMAVVRDGRMVASWYWNGTDAHSTQDVFSATKSVTSALVGIAEADGDLDRSESASTFVPSWVGTPAEAVRVVDLLSNDSGRHWDARTDYLSLTAAADRTGFAVGLPQDRPPGEVWVYNNAAIQTLDAVISAATGESTAEFAATRLLGPIGMADSSMSLDRAGGTDTYFGLRSTCEDMARFGLLYLQQGEWGGRQVVPAEWVQASIGGSSQPINSAYGYLWWLNRPGSVVANPLASRTAAEASAAPTTQLVPGAPQDMFWAIGLGGQIVQVDPASSTVVVRLGPGRTGDGGSGPGGASGYGPGDTARVVTEALVGDPASS
jgi:CubicO group peptidase (beta-lactamase class C family)